jgi:hypothetical protein
MGGRGVTPGHKIEVWKPISVMDEAAVEEVIAICQSSQEKKTVLDALRVRYPAVYTAASVVYGLRLQTRSNDAGGFIPTTACLTGSEIIAHLQAYQREHGCEASSVHSDSE